MQKEHYQGVEMGPIRPPSESESLMLRITRNCPWNKCKFCGLYKGKTFSVRPLDHVLKDIDTIRYYIDEIEKFNNLNAHGKQHELLSLTNGRPKHEGLAFHVARNWVRAGKKSVFLQDANTMIVKPDDLVRILKHIKQAFPEVDRITSYARSKTIAGISDSDMAKIAEAGLNRIHIGMESAADVVLDFVKKGVDKQIHILAGQKVKRAGIELSEYFMPGLGGEEHSQVNAIETADAMNQINPDFIRIRTLAIPERTELYKACQEGTFKKLGEIKVAEELFMFLDNLNGISSTIKSDHSLNLFQEVEGLLPDDKTDILSPIQEFLHMDPEDQMLYLVGRRTGFFMGLKDMKNEELAYHASLTCQAHGITVNNVEDFTAEIMKRFI